MSSAQQAWKYSYRFAIPAASIDANGHVNNVEYVQWMQEAAVRHYRALGGTDEMDPEGTWVVRAHRIEYLAPAFAAEEVELRTWVVDVSRVRLLRQYEFERLADHKVLVRGETEWVHVHAGDGRPLTIPPQVVELIPRRADAANDESRGRPD